jgi:hypothetical protein
MRKHTLSSMPAIALGLLAATTTQTRAQNSSALSGKTIEQLSAIDTAKVERTPEQKKISSRLWSAIKESSGRPSISGAPKMSSTLASVTEGQPPGKVSILIEGQVNAGVQQFVRSQGGVVTQTSAEDNVMTVTVALSKIEAIASRPEVKQIKIAVHGQLNLMPNPEGDAGHAADVARNKFKAAGKGVKICALSDSVDGLAQAVANKSLGPVEVLKGQQGKGTGEGTAMLEIIHRIAPDAKLGFAAGSDTELQMATNITALVNAQCDIIVDDITFPDESPFQDGLIAKRVNDASAKGVLYFSSAANSGNYAHNQSGTWEGDFKPVSSTQINLNGNTWYANEFAPGAYKNTVTSVDGPFATLFWNDPLGAATNEYDLYSLDADGNVLAVSDNEVSGTQDPYQQIDIAEGVSLLILQKSGALPRFLHLSTGRGRLAIGTWGSARGHNASGADNAFSVAAVSAQDRAQPFVGGANVLAEDYSSDGPRRIFYYPNGMPITPGNLTSTGGKKLDKPDVTGADCVTTDTKLKLFCGTSAAAPQVAAIAALVKSSNPALSPAQIRQILTSTTLDIESAGWDEVSGYGIVMADAAVRAAQPPVAALSSATNTKVTAPSK